MEDHRGAHGEGGGSGGRQNHGQGAKGQSQTVKVPRTRSQYSSQEISHGPPVAVGTDMPCTCRVDRGF